MQGRDNKANLTAGDSLGAVLIGVLRKRGCLKSPVRYTVRRDLCGEGVGNCPLYRDSLPLIVQIAVVACIESWSKPLEITLDVDSQ